MEPVPLPRWTKTPTRRRLRCRGHYVAATSSATSCPRARSLLSSSSAEACSSCSTWAAMQVSMRSSASGSVQLPRARSSQLPPIGLHSDHHVAKLGCQRVRRRVHDLVHDVKFFPEKHRIQRVGVGFRQPLQPVDCLRQITRLCRVLTWAAGLSWLFVHQQACELVGREAFCDDSVNQLLPVRSVCDAR